MTRAITFLVLNGSLLAFAATAAASDFNGDGTDDILWQHENGQVHFWPIRDGQRVDGFNISDPVGPPWRLVGSGDFNGDGTDDVLWQHENGQVHYWPVWDGERVDGFNISDPVGRPWRLVGAPPLPLRAIGKYRPVEEASAQPSAQPSVKFDDSQ